MTKRNTGGQACFLFINQRLLNGILLDEKKSFMPLISDITTRVPPLSLIYKVPSNESSISWVEPVALEFIHLSILFVLELTSRMDNMFK